MGHRANGLHPDPGYPFETARLFAFSGSGAPGDSSTPSVCHQTSLVNTGARDGENAQSQGASAQRLNFDIGVIHG